MALRGQRFHLNPDADDFTFDLRDESLGNESPEAADSVKDIKEREIDSAPLPPKPKHGRTGFPLHRSHGNIHTSRARSSKAIPRVPNESSLPSNHRGPSDRAIVNQISRKYGLDPESKEKREIGEENQRRIAQMSTQDIEQARSEIMSSLSPEFVERLLKRANIEEDRVEQDWDSVAANQSPGAVTMSKSSLADNVTLTKNTTEAEITPVADSEDQDILLPHRNPDIDAIQPQFHQIMPAIHFPVPPRNPDNYVPLDPDSPSFLSDLKKHYFPDLPEDPSTLGWLQDPTDDESESSPYAPTQSRYAPSDIRFDFTGRLIAPNESRDIPQSKGLHHHGQAPESAGYTIPELSLLARSSLPNQRCVAYQILGRMLYRLGRGDFGPRGTELQDGLWACVERERPLEVVMSEANRVGGHVSAKAHATEALWLWRKGGGGERGILKPGEKIAQ